MYLYHTTNLPSHSRPTLVTCAVVSLNEREERQRRETDRGRGREEMSRQKNERVLCERQQERARERDIENERESAGHSRGVSCAKAGSILARYGTARTARHYTRTIANPIFTSPTSTSSCPSSSPTPSSPPPVASAPAAASTSNAPPPPPLRDPIPMLSLKGVECA